MLGIDSAFSILEAPMVVVGDFLLKRNIKVAKWKITTVFTLLAYLCSLFYATDAGLIFLDTVDFYINFGFILIGFFETFGAGWIFGIEDQIKEIGSSIVFSFMVTNFGSIIVACCIWFGMDNGNEVWAGFVALIACYLGGACVTLFFCSQKIAQDPGKWSWNSILYVSTLKNVMDLRQELAIISGYMPWMWAFMMKHLIPHILLVLFVNLAQSDNGKGEPQFGHYESYVTYPFQFVGILCVCSVFVVAIVGVIAPVIFEPFDLTAIDLALAKDMAIRGVDDDSKEKEEALEVEPEEEEA